MVFSILEYPLPFPRYSSIFNNNNLTVIVIIIIIIIIIIIS